MSKIKITADTDTGEMTVDVNGAAVANFREVNLYFYPGETSNMVGAAIETFMQDDNGVRHYGRICAAQSPDGKVAYYAGGLPSKVEGFINDPNYKNTKDQYADAVQAIAKMRERK